MTIAEACGLDENCEPSPENIGKVEHILEMMYAHETGKEKLLAALFIDILSHQKALRQLHKRVGELMED